MTGNELLGTRYPAPRQQEMAQASWQSWDYANMQPYPRHAFGPLQWPPEKGPRPTALPYAAVLITEGAEFIFRNGPPSFSVADNDEATEFIGRVIAANALNGQWIALAENNGHQGAVAAKFSMPDDNPNIPVRVSFLDIPQECRLWIDPHDITRVLMARIQYPYRDLADGQWYYYREEWTDDWFVTYEPTPAGGGPNSLQGGLPGYISQLGDQRNFVVADREPNPFGVVPVTPIRNRAVKGNPFGEGDLWRAFRLIDRIALTMHGEDISNQFHSRPTTVFENASPENAGPLVPGEAIQVVNTDPTGAAASVSLLEPHGRAREQTQWTIEKWEDLLYKDAGLSRVNPAEVTNKGNMTALAFAMTYGRTIATSDRKRELWGESGMGIFFRNMLIGLQRVGGFKELAALPDDLTVSVEWPPYFEETAADVTETTNRTIDQVEAGMLPEDRGALRIARAEKMPKQEVDEVMKELKVQRANQRRRQTRASRTASSGMSASTDRDEQADIAAASGANNFTG